VAAGAGEAEAATGMAAAGAASAAGALFEAWADVGAASVPAASVGDGAKVVELCRTM
jgi:hypothetical protein